MRGLKMIAPVTLGLALAVSASSAFAAGDPRGVWLDDTGRGAVEIKDCGDGLCGTVVWAKSEKDSKEGCGKQILGGVKDVGGGNWDNGWVYDPERGRKFDLALTPMKNGSLQVTGYAGYKFLSQTMIWTKAPSDLQRCDKPDGQAEKTSAKKDDTAAASPAKPEAKDDAAEAKTSDDDASEKVAKAEPEARKSSPSAKTADEPAEKSEKSESDAKDSDKSASNDKKGDAGNIKIGDLELDKMFTKTKSGKCKVDLPFVKMTFDCEQ